MSNYTFENIDITPGVRDQVNYVKKQTLDHLKYVRFEDNKKVDDKKYILEDLHTLEIKMYEPPTKNKCFFKRILDMFK